MQTKNTLMLNELLKAPVRKRLNDVFILHAKQNKGIELWFWCKTEFPSNQMKSSSADDLRDIIQRIYHRLLPEHKITLKPQLIQMSHLASDFAERRLSIRHMRDHDTLNGFIVNRKYRYSEYVTCLADKVYIAQKQEILVYENKFPYRVLEPIVFGHVGVPVSIASCNINKCLYVSFDESFLIFKVEPELDNRAFQWLRETGILFISVTSKGDALILETETRSNGLRIFTPEGTVKRTIPMKPYRFFQITFIKEIMPDVVVVIYEKPLEFSPTYIGIMSLDEGGTILRHIQCRQKIFSLSPFRYGDLLIGTITRKDDADNYVLAIREDRVQMYHWPFESNVARDLLETDESIISIHFSADQNQFYVLSHKKLHIYELSYEDEDT